MVGWKPENKERTKMKTYLSIAERDVILNKLLEFSKTRTVEGFHYCYAFGYISAMLTDEQIKDLEKGLK